MAESKRFLVVEDNPAVGEMCRDALEPLGLAVELVETAADARQQTAEPLLGVLVDYQLPDGSGLELFQDLRAQQPGLPGILMTGYDNLGSATRSPHEGLVGFLPKPFSITRLQEEAGYILERQQWRQEADRLRLLHQLQQQLHALWSLREVPAVYDFVLDVALREVPADRASLQRLWGEELVVLAARGQEAERLLLAPPFAAGSVAQWVLTTRRPLCLDARHPPPFELAPYLRQPAIRAALCVPLVAWEKPLGVLNLTRLQNNEPFNGHTVEKIHLLTTQAALTLDRLEQEEQRRQQEKLATVGHLASTIVHDLRNPLQGIMGYADMLVLSTDDQVKERARHILEQAQRMTELCEDLMDYVRGQSQLHPEPRTASDFLEEAVAEKEIPTGIAVEIKPTYPGMVSADPRKLRRALVNLIANAYEAMPAGGTLRLETQVDAEYVWFVVEDTGVGIPSDVQARLGEPFFTHGKTNGTGLGLAIVRSIAEAHGGRLCITSQVGRGTCVELGLPSPNGIAADPTSQVGQGPCVEPGRPLPEGRET